MAAHGSSELVVYSLDRLTGALAELLQRAAAAGEICADIDPEDLLRTLVGMQLRPRPAGLASQGAAPGRCLHRWTTPATR
jgi:hypothetical protein